MRQDVFNEVKRQMANDIKINYSEIARRLGCDPRTAKRYIDGTPKRKVRDRKSVLDEYKNVIIDKVDNYGVTAKACYQFINKKGYCGGYTTVKNFVREHKMEQLKKATVRFETTPGLQAQVDWKEEFTLITKGGEPITFNLFLLILGYSRTKYVKLTFDRKQDTLFNSLISAFNFIGGVPVEVLFDNMSTVVDRVSSSFGNIKLNSSMAQFAKDFNFNINVCRPYRPQTKGKVEALAKLVDRLKVYNNEFSTIEELNSIISEFNIEINSELSQSIKKSPFEILEKEKEYLNALPAKDIIDSYLNCPVERKVTKESMITYKENKYSVPVKYVNEIVQISIYGNLLKIYYKDQEIARHVISKKPLNYQTTHLKEIFKSDAFSSKSEEYIEEMAIRHLAELDKLLEG